jgi:D-beta-D-heptose 7-phosphate kinase / D-beta-D-heptose 1-phosphate adenosyltransferase
LNEQTLKQIKPAPVLVAGDVMVDEYILGDVERISPESPVPVLIARDRLRRLGGAGNVVRNLVTMGGKVALFATVGKDSAGNWFKRHCEEIGIDAFWIKDDLSRPTTIKTRVVARNQQIVRIDQEYAGSISAEIEKAIMEDAKSLLSQVKAAVLSDYGKGFLTPSLIQEIISLAKINSVPILVDPKGKDFSKYRGATFVTPNVREAATASGVEIYDRESLVRAGRILLDQMEAQGVIITRGREGITLVTDSKAEDFPVKPVEIVDVTGAGDTVIASLALALAGGLPIENGIGFANLAASIVVSRFGAAAVSLDEMIQSLKDRQSGTKVVSIEDIGTRLREHRLRGRRLVFTNGCFDLFHAGHLEILRRASELGDVLVVGVNSDNSVSRLKGPSRPIVSQAQRIEIISAFNFVDYVVVFEDDTPLNLIKEVRPDILVKGDDWQGKKVVGEEFVSSRGGRVEFVKLLNGVSTTELLKKIMERE